jgi:hypothetical protein
MERSGSVQINYGSGSRRPKNIRLWNTEGKVAFLQRISAEAHINIQCREFIITHPTRSSARAQLSLLAVPDCALLRVQYIPPPRPPIWKGGGGWKCAFHRVLIGVEEKYGECTCPLSYRAYTTTLLVMVWDRVKGRGRASPTLTSLGWFYHHDGM